MLTPTIAIVMYKKHNVLFLKRKRYTKSMFHVIATYARRERALTISLGTSLAVLYLLLVVLQLVSFEELPTIIDHLWALTDKELGAVIAACVAISEVFALPYLLGMQLSRAMRALTGLFAFIAASYWYAIGWRTAYGAVLLADTGLGGTYLRIPAGAWLMWFGAGVFMLLAWYTARLVLESKK